MTLLAGPSRCNALLVGLVHVELPEPKLFAILVNPSVPTSNIMTNLNRHHR